jgi:hypothetical protein
MCCAPCQESIRLIVYARTHMWRYGKIPEPLVEPWSKAQSMIPNWPVFKRLTLDDMQMRDLSRCPEQFDVTQGTVASRPDPFQKYRERRTPEVPGLIRPGAITNLQLDPSHESRVMRCPKCREFVDSSAKKCRFCNAELDSREIDSAVAERAKEKADANEKELGRLKISLALGLTAAVIYFLVPAAQMGGTAIKLIIVFLIIGLSLAVRLR